MRSIVILPLALLLLVACGEGRPDVDALVAGLDRGTHEERLEAAMGLAALGEEGIAPLRRRLLRDEPAPADGTPFEVQAPEKLDGRFYAAQGLGAIGTEGVSALLDVLDGRDEVARVEAQRVLAGLTLDDAALERVAAILGGTNVMAASRAAELLGAQSPEAAQRVIDRIARDERPLVRRRAMLTGAQREDALAEATVVRFLADPSMDVRAEAAKLAGTRITMGLATPALRSALVDRLRVEAEEPVVAWLLAALGQDSEDQALPLAGLLHAAPDSLLAERLPGLLASWRKTDEPIRTALDAVLVHGSPRAQLRAIVALASLLDHARQRGEAWWTPVEVADHREGWAERVLEIARATDPPDADALLALGVFPEVSAAAEPLLRAALQGEDGERALAAILGADTLARPARVALRPDIERWRTSTQAATREAAEAWLERHGDERAEAEAADTAGAAMPGALRGPPAPAPAASDPVDDDGR
ncbi:MAG: hypothetical protein AB7T63_08500 [Planctomycetota bacterium]